MTWTELDDSFADREDIATLTDAAFRVHVEGMIWCNRLLTDGRVPGNPRMLARVLPGATQAVVDELLAAGLCGEMPDGWVSDTTDASSTDPERGR